MRQTVGKLWTTTVFTSLFAIPSLATDEPGAVRTIASPLVEAIEVEVNISRESVKYRPGFLPINYLRRTPTSDDPTGDDSTGEEEPDDLLPMDEDDVEPGSGAEGAAGSNPLASVSKIDFLWTYSETRKYKDYNDFSLQGSTMLHERLKGDLKVPRDWESNSWPASAEAEVGTMLDRNVGVFGQALAGLGGERTFDWGFALGVRVNF